MKLIWAMVCGLGIVIGLLMSSVPAVAGPYDGLWGDHENDFVMVRSDGETILLVGFGLDSEWSLIWIGTLDGNTISIQTYSPYFKATATGTITSPTTINGTVTSCSGTCTELFAGEKFTLTKLF